MDTRTSTGIYTDLDTLFDTRYSLLEKLYPDVAESVIVENKYYDRLSNTYGPLGSNLWNYIYRHRTKEVLIDVIPTFIFDTVITIYDSTLKQDINSGTFKEFTLFVNTYPYNLNEDECVAMQAGLESIAPQLGIELINIPQDDITMNWLYSRVSHVIMYNVLEWVEGQGKLGLAGDNTHLNMVLIGPGMVVDEDVLKKVNNYEKYFADMTEQLKPILNIEFLSSRMFSMAIT